jgi:hypothetical protein
MSTNTAWAALITRLPATEDLPLATLLALIEASSADLKDRTGSEIANTLGAWELANCRTAAALSQAQPRLRDPAGHDAASAWAVTHLAKAGIIYRRHARVVLTEINANPLSYLHNHTPRQAHEGPAEDKEDTAGSSI